MFKNPIHILQIEDEEAYDKFISDVADIIENKVHGDPQIMFLIGEELQKRSAKDFEDAMNQIANIFK